MSKVEVLNSVKETREKLTNIILGITAFFAFFLIAAALHRAQSYSDPTIWVRIVNYSLFILLFLFRRKIPLSVKAGFILFAGIFSGASSLLLYGNSGGAAIVLMATSIAAAIMLNTRLSAAIAIFSALLIALQSYLLYSGNALNEQAVAELSVNYKNWILLLVVFLAMSLAQIVALHLTFKVINQAHAKLEQNLALKTAKAEHSESLLQAIIDAVPYRIFWKDNSHAFRGANQAFLKDVGEREEKSLIGKKDEDLKWIENAGILRHEEADIINSGDSLYSTETTRQRADGSFFYVQENKVPLKGGDGSIVGILVAYDDISQSKQQQLELQLAKEKAERANRAKSTFLANMSHELRTPLNGVNGLIDLVLAEQLTDKQKNYLEKAKISAGNLLDIISDILDISKIEAGKLVIDKTPLRPADVIEKVNVIIDPWANQKGLSFNVECLGDVNAYYLGDSTRLFQVFLNLCSNAIKFTEEGEVTLSIEMQTEDVPRLSFSIQDTGIGIEEDKLSSLFDSFSQADSSVTRRFGGTGLGLAIVKRLVELMGGKISISSDVGAGSEFSGYVNLEALEAEQRKQLISQKKQYFDLSHITVLLVEDNEINQLVAVDMLRAAKARVITANNGMEAVQRLKMNPVDIVLMDIQMPVMDGKEALKKMQQDSTFSKIPVVALTANVMSHEIAEYIGLGFKAHLGKPFEKEQLYKIVQRFALQS